MAFREDFSSASIFTDLARLIPQVCFCLSWACDLNTVPWKINCDVKQTIVEVQSKHLSTKYCQPLVVTPAIRYSHSIKMVYTTACDIIIRHVQVVVKPCIKVTSVIQPLHNYGHPGTVPKYFCNKIIEHSN